MEHTGTRIVTYIKESYIQRKKKGRKEERDARRNCGWDSDAESHSKPQAFWATPPE